MPAETPLPDEEAPIIDWILAQAERIELAREADRVLADDDYEGA